MDEAGFEDFSLEAYQVVGEDEWKKNFQDMMGSLGDVVKYFQDEDGGLDPSLAEDQMINRVAYLFSWGEIWGLSADKFIQACQRLKNEFSEYVSDIDMLIEAQAMRILNRRPSAE